MARLRESKRRLKDLLSGSDWREHIEEIANGGLANVGALFSFLLLAPGMMHRAACALGALIAKIADEDPEAARNIVRRFMWHMNEESGNIGWGIPPAFAETLCRSPLLAKTYSSILISYIMDLGHDDNYCDNNALRRQCYWAVGRFGHSRPDLAEKSRPWLLKGLADEDEICRGMAAWALAQLPPALMDAPALKRLEQSQIMTECEFFDGEKMKSETVRQLAQAALQRDLEHKN